MAVCKPGVWATAIPTARTPGPRPLCALHTPQGVTSLTEEGPGPHSPRPCSRGGSGCWAPCSLGDSEVPCVSKACVSGAGTPGHLRSKEGRRKGEEGGGDRSSQEAAVGMPCPAFCHRLPAACQCGLAGLLLQGTRTWTTAPALGPWSFSEWEVRGGRP